MPKRRHKIEKEFMDEVNLCLKKTRGIKVLMGRLEEALTDLDKKDCTEVSLAAMQDLNILLGGLVTIWDQWTSGMSIELDRLIKYTQKRIGMRYCYEETWLR
jgi:hypothetical protein